MEWSLEVLNKQKVPIGSLHRKQYVEKKSHPFISIGKGVSLVLSVSKFEMFFSKCLKF